MNKTPEQKARDTIDTMLERAGWAVVDKNAINWSLGPGLAVREYQTDVGPADYVLFVEREPIGVIEAKRERKVTGCLSMNSRRKTMPKAN